MLLSKQRSTKDLLTNGRNTPWNWILQNDMLRRTACPQKVWTVQYFSQKLHIWVRLTRSLANWSVPSIFSEVLYLLNRYRIHNVSVFLLLKIKYIRNYLCKYTAEKYAFKSIDLYKPQSFLTILFLANQPIGTSHTKIIVTNKTVESVISRVQNNFIFGSFTVSTIANIALSKSKVCWP